MKGKAKTTTTAEHGEKKLKIFDHCADLFDKVGYHKMTMQMLADEAGMGKPTLYHYFPSKAAILFEMHQTHMELLIEDLEDTSDGCTHAASLLTKACTSTLRQISEHPGYVRAFMDHYGDLQNEHRGQIRKLRDKYLKRIRKIITDGISSGAFRDNDPDITVFAFLGICNWAYKWYPRMASECPPPKMAEKLCQVILDGLVAK